ncbi:MAG: thioesterase family protein [Acidimicrobiales bacterium]|nr:thioesterase family protein [Acidimicrobiales bacterium]MCB9396031.1 thioesterase family protein [Acidimicrobiaceae bacterium]
MTAADAAFLGLDDGGGRHSMQIEARHCTSHDFLYGGSGVAACAAAAEAVTGRPLVWITTQYIGQARPGERLELDVDVLVAARSTSQTIVRAHVGDRLVLHATTAHTDRPVGDEAWWDEMPAVPTPDRCAPFSLHFDQVERDSFFRLLDRRAPADWNQRTDGRIPIWVRVPGWGIGTPASQAFVADIVPVAVMTALGRMTGATSLDNTLRVVHGEPYDGWVLLDVEAQGYRRSIGHGQVRLWRPDGVLLGIGSQTCIVRTGAAAGPVDPAG